MKIFLFAIIGLLFWLSPTSNVGRSEHKNLKDKYNNSEDIFEKNVLDIYTKCNLKDKLEYRVFNRAVIGYSYFNLTNKKVITIIDFSKPSTEKRLFIIDIENRKLLFQTFVAHGKNSGLIKPTKFSNRIGSNQSSLGFYRTAGTYTGKHGYSLMLDGLEKDINDNARKRAIVIHGAKYVSNEFIKKNNRLGRSWGCPAVSDEISKEIIDLIKDGSCLYIYANNVDYTEHPIEQILMPHRFPTGINSSGGISVS
jgi:hypothetical protein